MQDGLNTVKNVMVGFIILNYEMKSQKILGHFYKIYFYCHASILRCFCTNFHDLTNTVYVLDLGNHVVLRLWCTFLI